MLSPSSSILLPAIYYAPIKSDFLKNTLHIVRVWRLEETVSFCKSTSAHASGWHCMWHLLSHQNLISLCLSAMAWPVYNQQQ